MLGSSLPGCPSHLTLTVDHTRAVSLLSPLLLPVAACITSSSAMPPGVRTLQHEQAGCLRGSWSRRGVAWRRPVARRACHPRGHAAIEVPAGQRPTHPAHEARPGRGSVGGPVEGRDRDGSPVLAGSRRWRWSALGSAQEDDPMDMDSEEARACCPTTGGPPSAIRGPGGDTSPPRAWSCPSRKPRPGVRTDWI